ncbi:hypothetical protein AHAS_Ahas01G0190100 [Arachis hypogaea]
MGTTNSGSSCSHEKRYDGCKENWSARMSSGRSNLVEASKRRKKKFVSPMCNCDPYIILFEFGTLQNSRGLFLDEYVASFGINEVATKHEVADPMKNRAGAEDG